MLQYKISIFLLAAAFIGGSPATLSDEVCSGVNKSIRSGNAQSLSKYFSSTVELSVLGKEAYVSKAQATSILTDFFKENPPKSYAVKQGGSNSENTKFVIGTYVSTAGKTFKIYYVVKKEKSTESIQKLTIEKK
jgi:hypothetical protein